MNKLNHIGLFEGIGGFSLAAHRAGWETKAWCELNKFCQRVLNYHFPNAIPHEDITNTDFTIYRGYIDVLTGGFPCQGFSLAGTRKGTDDDRYLWPEMRRAYQEIQPSIIIGENVTGILSMEDKSGIYRDVFAKVESRKVTQFCEIDKYEAIYTRQTKMLVDSICNDLEEDGYEVQPIVIPASAVQAPHRRDRVWFIAYSNGYDARRSGFRETGQTEGKAKEQKDQWQWIWNEFKRTGFKRNVANSNSERFQEPNISRSGKKQGFSSRANNAGNVSNANSFGLWGEINGIRKPEFINEACAKLDWKNFPTELPILFGDDGLSSKLDGITFSELRSQSIKSAGNAIVHQVALEFFKEINEQIKINNAA